MSQGTLVEILTGEQLPREPRLEDSADLVRYVRELHVYLERLASQLTGSNISRTLQIEVPNLGLPDIPDPDKSYVLVYDTGDDTVKWIETTEECP